MSNASQFYHGRKLQYEIYVQVQGRWQLRQTMDDGRTPGVEFTQFDFERLESAVVKVANTHLAGQGIQAVKVLRERVTPTGTGLQTEIFRKEATPTPDRSIAKTLNEPLPPLETMFDLARRPVARGIGIIVRDFLTKSRVTTLEFLHHTTCQKSFAGNSTLYQATVHQVASKQAEARKIPMKVALAEMHKVFEHLQRRAKDAQLDKRFVRRADLPYPAMYAELASEEADDELRFAVFTTIARRLEGTPSHFSRLAWAFDGLDSGVDPQASTLLDELVASCLDDPQFVMDLLGAQPSLGAALGELAAIASGKLEIGPKTPEEMGRLSTFIASGTLPLSQTELWDRITRSVDGPSPLMRKDASREWATTIELQERIGKLVPATFVPQLDAAFARRKKTLRNRD